MLTKKSCFFSLGLLAGCLVIYNAGAHEAGDTSLALTMNSLEKQQQNLTQSSDITIRDAESSLLQARHVLMEDKPQTQTPDAEFRQLQRLVNVEVLNLERARNIASRNKHLKPRG